MLSSVANIFGGQNLPRLLQGFLVTLEVAAVVLVIGGILGILLGVLRTLHITWLNVVLRLYLEIFRIVPTVVLLFVAYYILPQSFGINLSGFGVAVLVFTLWTGAEMSDIVRGALESVPQHQRESGIAIGLTTTQLYRYVLVPQSVPMMLPGVINLATRIIKTTSLLLLINVMDLVNVGQTLVEAEGHKYPDAGFWIYGAMFILYYILCAPLSHWAKHMERREMEIANG